MASLTKQINEILNHLVYELEVEMEGVSKSKDVFISEAKEKISNLLIQDREERVKSLQNFTVKLTTEICELENKLVDYKLYSDEE